QNTIDPGKRLDTNMYTNKSVHDVPKLPENLLDSLRALDTNKVLSDWFGPDFVGSYIKLKKEEWNSYTQHFTEWERTNALDI
ncbi:MAG: type III glutamate--ammonia ligase, partial [Alphaproteobacteria bacterium]